MSGSLVRSVDWTSVRKGSQAKRRSNAWKADLSRGSEFRQRRVGTGGSYGGFLGYTVMDRNGRGEGSRESHSNGSEGEPAAEPSDYMMESHDDIEVFAG
jgi:hypothetical protein